MTTPSFYSFSFETTKDTAGCRAFHRNYIVGGQQFDPSSKQAEENYLLPVCKQLHRQLVKHEVLHADEPPLRVVGRWASKPVR